MKVFILSAVVWLLAITSAFAEEAQSEHQAMASEHHQHSNMLDQRISLNLPPAMKQHQLANMRGHLAAVQDIVRLLGQDDFSTAANVARNQLGLTPQMEKMCRNFDNESFTQLGLSFHRSADTLAEVLEKSDLSESLAALSSTMSHCVSCHAQFKQ